MSKQDYFIKLLTEHEISVRADYRVADAIAKEIFQLSRVIKKVGKLNEIEDEKLLYILEIYEEIKKEKNFRDKDQIYKIRHSRITMFCRIYDQVS